MSGLSAKISSCGGEGGRLGRGGETTGGGATSLVAFFALMKMGASFWISLSECSDSPLLSLSSAMVRACRCCRGDAKSCARLEVEVEVRLGSTEERHRKLAGG